MTPSGRGWALEAATESVPGATFLDGTQFPSSSVAIGIADAFQVADAATVSPDLVASIGSFAAGSSMASMFARAQADEKEFVAWFPGSAASAVSDVQSLAALIDISGIVPSDDSGARELVSVASAIERGEIELLLVCPPEESAIEAAVQEIAAATACGLRVRGVAVCPMPRKSDGWPKTIRKAAKSHVDDLAHALHSIPVHHARRGKAPAFTKEGVDVCAPLVSEHAGGQRVWSLTIPGLSQCDVAIGTWTADPAYPTTHVVLDIAGRVARRRVDSTIRRCEPIDVVVSGDSVAITFEPHADQWPTERTTGNRETAMDNDG
jgi:hypothetical protein